jgi:hypothetical protein
MPKPKLKTAMLDRADVPPPPLHLFRLRCTYQSTHEGEPHYIVGTCREAVAELWYSLNMRDMEDPCELVIDQIRSAEESYPA